MKIWNTRFGCLVLFAVLALAGCGGGGTNTEVSPASINGGSSVNSSSAVTSAISASSSVSSISTSSNSSVSVSGGAGASSSATSSRSGSSNSAVDKPTLILSRQQVSLGASSTVNWPPFTDIGGTISGSISTVYVSVAYTTNAIQGVSSPVVSNGSATSRITFKTPNSLGHRAYQDKVTVTACADALCTKPLEGSPAIVEVTFVVGLPITPSLTAFESVEGAVAAPQALTISAYYGTASWSSSVSYTSGTNWLKTLPNSGATLPANVAVSTSALPAGSYAAQLTFTASDPSKVTESRVLPVQLNVLPLLAVSGSLQFSVTNQKPAAGQAQTASIVSRDPARQSGWSAISSTPWLHVATSTGNTAAGSPLRVELNATELMKLPNGTYSTTVQIKPDRGDASTISVPVQLTLDRSHVDVVAPYIEKENVAREVVLRGSRLADAPITSISFGVAPVEYFKEVTESRIVVKPPALPAGRYPVVVSTAAGQIESNVELLVKGTSNYAPLSKASYPGSTAYFDKERDSCYITTFGNDTPVIALRKNGSTWDTQVSPGVYSVPTDVRLTADGRELLVFVGTDYVVHLDPVTLVETKRSIASDADLGPGLGFAFHSTVTTDTGFLLTVRGGKFVRYQPVTGKFSVAGPAYYDVDNFVSEAGNRFVWSTSRLSDLNFSILDTDSLITRPFYQGTRGIHDVKSDRFGIHWAIGGESSYSNFPVIVLGYTGELIGTIPYTSTRGDMVMTPDGSKLYVEKDATIEVFDLGTASATGVYTPAKVLNIQMPSSDGYVPDIALSANEDAIIGCHPRGVWAIALP